MKSWIREKKYECGEYRTVGIYAVTDQEHRQRGKKQKESSRGQKARNKNASMRRYQRKVLANFDKDGFYVTGSYTDAYRPECFEDCAQDVRNYERRVKAAVTRRFGAQRARRLKLSLHAARNGKGGKLHMHGFAECKGLTADERREFREILEDLWRRRVPGTGEFEPLGTINADRIDMQKILGIDGQGKNGTVGYIYGHSERRCVETRNLTMPEELRAADTKWSRRQLRLGCSEHAEDAAWWEQRFPGWEVVQVMVYDPQQLYETDRPRPDGWESTDPQAYLILRRRRFAKVRT